MKRKESPWFEGELPEKSYRSIFKWGDSLVYKHPNSKLFALMKKKIGRASCRERV